MVRPDWRGVRLSKEVNAEIYGMLLHTLHEMSIQDWDLDTFWQNWLWSGQREAREKGIAL